jgi:hypothetical protein
VADGAGAEHLASLRVADEAIARQVMHGRGRSDDGGVTIVFRVPASAVERVGFSYSPSLEAVLSLHVLVEPKHHPVQHGWVRAMRRLSPALKREIDVFAFAFRAYFPEFFFPSPAGELLDFAGSYGVCARLIPRWCAWNSRSR